MGGNGGVGARRRREPWVRGRAFTAEVARPERTWVPRAFHARLFAARRGSATPRQKDGEGGAAYPEPDITAIRGGPSTCGSLFAA